MRWYYYLNNKKERNLVSNEQIDDETLIIGNWATKKRYTTFRNHTSFYDYSQTVPFKERCFFEILLPNIRRKMYFDVDMEVEDFGFEEHLFVDHTIAAITTTIKESGERREPTILVFVSHTSTKRSYHFVVDNFYLQNYEECRQFFHKTIEHIDEIYVPFFDPKVYNKTQQFRIVGSHKWQKDNLKRLVEKYSYNYKLPPRYQSERGEKLYILQHSLISRMAGCSYLMGFSPVKKERMVIEGDASENDFEEVMKIVKESKQWKKGIFELCEMVEENGNLIIPYRSLCGYWCYGCKRTHEAENPYIGVVGVEREIIFDCRRGSRQFLGKLGTREGEKVEEIPYGIDLPKEGEGEENDNHIKIPPSPVPLVKEKKGRAGRLDRLMGVSCEEDYVPRVNLNVGLKLYG